MQIVFKRRQQQHATSTVVCLGFAECKGREVVVESAFLWEVRTSFKKYIYYVYIFIRIIHIIDVNLPRDFHNTLSVENQLLVARFHPFSQCPILRWALRCESRLPCRRSFYPWISWVSGKPGDRGRLFGQTFWKSQGLLCRL